MSDHSSNSWVKKLSLTERSRFRLINIVNNFTAGGKVLGYRNEEDMNGPLFVYDPVVDVIESVEDASSNYDIYFLVDNYVESLISVVPAAYVGA